jgi:hypothetical protein
LPEVERPVPKLVKFAVAVAFVTSIIARFEAKHVLTERFSLGVDNKMPATRSLL